MSDQYSNGKSAPRRSGGFLRGLLMFIVIVVVFFAIGVGIYYGVPYVESRVIKPIQENTREIETIQNRQEETDRASTDRISGLQAQIDALNVQQDKDKEALADLRGRLEGAEGWKMADELIEGRLDALAQRLDSLEESQTQVLAAITAQEKGTQNLSAQVSALEKSVQEQAEPLRQLRLELGRLRAAENLARCRETMLQGNFGDARTCVEGAQAALNDLSVGLDEADGEMVLDVTERLNLTVENLPDAPLLALKDLDIARDMLMQDFSRVDVRELPTLALPSPEPPSPKPAPVTSTPAAEPSVTPVPTPTATPTTTL